MKQSWQRICSLLLAVAMLLSIGAPAALAETVDLGSAGDADEKLMLMAAAGLTDTTSFSCAFSDGAEAGYEYLQQINAVGMEAAAWMITAYSYTDGKLYFEVEWFPDDFSGGIGGGTGSTDISTLDEAYAHFCTVIAAGDTSATELWYAHPNGDGEELAAFHVKLVATLEEAGIENIIETCEHRYREDGTLAVYVKLNWNGAEDGTDDGDTGDTAANELDEALEYIVSLWAAGDFSKTEFYFAHANGSEEEMYAFVERLCLMMAEYGIDGTVVSFEHRYREDGTLAVYLVMDWGSVGEEPETPDEPDDGANAVIQEAYDFILFLINNDETVENSWNFGNLNQDAGENSAELLAEFRAVMEALAEESARFTVVDCFYWYDIFGNCSICLEVEWTEGVSGDDPVAECTHEYSWFVAPVDGETHAATCTNCGAVMKTESHHTLCNATPNVCMLCGVTTGTLNVWHENTQYSPIDALTHAEICTTCGETLSTSEHFALCNGTHGVCVDCAFASSTVGLRHSPSAADPSICQRCGETISEKPEEPEQPVDGESAYAAVYSYDYYIGKYADLAAAFNGDRAAVLNHFLTSGMAEGRQGSADFNVEYYRANYADLAGAFGDNLALYYQHYVGNGKAEGRVANALLTPAEPEQPAETPDNRESAYAAVYDFDYYTGKYADIAAAFGGDRTATLEHFINNGMSEGRQGSSSFNVDCYRANYADLRNAFGGDLKAYYTHYMHSGKAEGRVANKLIESTPVEPEQPEVDPNAPDKRESYYAPVYDFNDYVERYPDVKAAFGGNRTQTLDHFINHGMSEGRQGNSEFMVSVYRANYPDLENAFGSDLKDYYKHYISNGKAEGRDAH